MSGCRCASKGVDDVGAGHLRAERLCGRWCDIGLLLLLLLWLLWLTHRKAGLLSLQLRLRLLLVPSWLWLLILRLLLVLRLLWRLLRVSSRLWLQSSSTGRVASVLLLQRCLTSISRLLGAEW